METTIIDGIPAYDLSRKEVINTLAELVVNELIEMIDNEDFNWGDDSEGVAGFSKGDIDIDGVSYFIGATATFPLPEIDWYAINSAYANGKEPWGDEVKGEVDPLSMTIEVDELGAGKDHEELDLNFNEDDVTEAANKIVRKLYKQRLAQRCEKRRR